MSGYDPTGLMTMSCTVVHTAHDGPADEYGDPTVTVTMTTSRCWLAQQTRTEEDAGAVEVDRWHLYLPSGTPIDADDAVMVGEETYQVYGAPWHTFHPYFRRPWHVEATLHRTL